MANSKVKISHINAENKIHLFSHLPALKGNIICLPMNKSVSGLNYKKFLRCHKK